MPQESGSRWAGSAITDSSGNAQIRVLGQYDGAPAGKYTVIVTKVVSEGEHDYGLIDPKYNDITKPAFQIEVKEQKNDFVEDVGKLVRIRQ